MSEPVSANSIIRYNEPGTLVRPGIVGRTVRASMAALCMWTAWGLAIASSDLDFSDLSWWFLLALALILVTYVVNLGFGLSIGALPRYLSISLLVISAAVSLQSYGAVLGYPLWLVGTGWMTYVYTHLGASFFLSSIIATPGCEMRAFPHLLGLAVGKDAAEHYCPAFIDRIDQWEHGRTGAEAGEEQSTVDALNSNDLLRTGGRMLSIYGIPFVLIQLFGNFADFRFATLMPALCLIAVAIICSMNLLRCRRVHCYFLGPWMLLAGTMLMLYGFRVLDFGSGTWPIIVNTALLGGACISMHLEMALGTYLKRS